MKSYYLAERSKVDTFTLDTVVAVTMALILVVVLAVTTGLEAFCRTE